MRGRNYVIHVAFLSLLSLCFSGLALAEIEVVHKPLSPEALPAPGKSLQLTVQLRNTRNFQQPLRAQIIRDGQLFESVLEEGFLNERDMPTYVFEVAAPQGELVYSFTSIPGEAVELRSPKYRITRRCIEDLQLKMPKQGENFETHVQNLASYAVVLEKNVEALGSALVTLEELQKVINE